MVGAMPVNIIPKFYNDTIGGCNGMEDEIQVSIGSRVKSGDDFGTVKYIGEVQGYNGIWYGVEWDDVARGKHDGFVDNIQYFKTTKSNAGSFVRPNKISPLRTCADAIRKYYGDREDETVAAHRRTVINEWKREMGAPFIEMVGFEKIHQKHKNRMAIDMSEETLSQLSINFASLEKLNISVCDYEWSDILVLSHLWPKINEIIAAYNRIKKITPPEVTLRTLTILRLDGNPIDSWNEVNNLGRLKNLKVLSLNDCEICEIRFNNEPGNGKINVFDNLEVLFLNRNKINDWRSISELDKLKNLKKLYFLKNPIQNSEDYDTTSQLVIAKIGSLQELNGSIITRELRRGAEYDYLKRYGAEWKVAQQDAVQKLAFDIEHCRFQELIDKYGIPDDSLLVKQVRNTTLTSQLLEIILRDENGKILKKKFPSTMAVQKLVTLAQRLFSKTGNTGTPTLNLLDDQMKGAEIPLDNVMKDLAYYSIKNGDTILVRFR
ncbi:Tubulin-specific chaperone E [Papilio machaon]|uniref:Tubulin-specific chaperone E n=1 Tax=Papilio machaon TaxID=76193 RepID=A0A194RJW2_PAPMA|nr:Tubulin-specific chaperone E [Papilio machaon]